MHQKKISSSQLSIKNYSDYDCKVNFNKTQPFQNSLPLSCNVYVYSGVIGNVSDKIVIYILIHYHIKCNTQRFSENYP